MSLPDFSGTGYLAGEAPDGLTTVVSVPVPAAVQVLWRDPETDEEHLVASTTSAPDGTWRITGLNHELEYVVRGIKDGWNDVTVVGAVPTRMDVVTATGVLETNEDGNGVAGSMFIEGGLPPYTVSVVDPLPYGLEPVLDYRTLTVAGTSDDWGRWHATVRVMASNAVYVDVPVTVDINAEWTPEHMPVTPSIWLDHTTQVTDVSGYASAWLNRGSSGGGYTQANSSYRPLVLPAELSGKRVLRFDGNYMQMPGLDVFRNVTAASIFCVFRKRVSDASVRDRPVVLFGNNAVSTRAGIFAGRLAVNRIDVGGRRLDGNSYNYVQSGTPRSGDWVAAVATLDYSARTITLWVDGVFDSSESGKFDAAGATSDTTGLVNVIGSTLPITGGGHPGTYADVDVASVIALSVLEETNRQRLEGYYAHEYGLASKLPANHPFRHVRPSAATPDLQPSFSISPVVLGFVAAMSVGDAGAAIGPAVTPLGTWFNGGPSLSAGQGISVMSDGDDITVSLTSVTPPTTPVQAVLIDHKGMSIVTIALTADGSDYTGSVPGALDDGEVYYLRIEAA